ncbi:MAG: hypothetical protein M1813_007649 [Trichoglossum hirsutum]|nr:MAG: hypothetical protein M1813_007649 [Trichoglossum hirsutum]
MTFGIQSPYTLARLPHPVADGFKGRFLAADVVSGSRKRKRPEVAVGIDGEGVNIYDVQSPKLITSYALPPQSTFTCAPCSLRLRSKSSASIQRITYVSVANPTPRILCFSEKANKTPPRSGTFSDTNTITSHGDVNLPESPIIHLDVLPSGKELKIDVDVVAVHENGITRCLSADLSREYWHSSISTASPGDSLRGGPEGGLVVEYAATTDSAIARKGLLKSREDALSFLNPDASKGGQATPILFLVTRPSNNALLTTTGRSIHIISIQTSLSSDSLSSRKQPRSLLTSRLPLATPQTEASTGRARFTLHPSSGALYQVADDNLTVHDLSGAVPKILNQLSFKNPGPVSLLRISPATVLVASPESIDIYNTRHRSLQASLPTTDITSSDSMSRKRKLVDPDSKKVSEQVTLVSYFTDTRLAIGLAGLELVAIRITLPSESSVFGRRKRDDLLINAIGRGIGPGITIDIKPTLENLPTALERYHPGSALVNEHRMKRLITDMDRYAQREDLENFERVFAEEVGIKRDTSSLKDWRTRRDTWEKEHSLNRGKEANSMELANGLGRHGPETTGTPAPADGRSPKFLEERPLPRWVWPEEFRVGDHPLVDPQLVRYILDKMFSWNNGHQISINGEKGSEEHTVKPGLSIALYAPNVFHWLVESGNFSTSNLELSIRRTAPGDSFIRGLPAGSFVNALADFDPEMKLLLYVLRSSVYLDVGELLSALKLLMRSLEFPVNGTRSTLQRITSGDDFGLPVINGNSAIALRLEEDAAQRDLDLALSVLEIGSAVREEALTAVLIRLHSFPSATTVKAMRRDLSGDEVLSLVQLLRNELSRGGWTSSYLDEDVEDFDEEQQSANERGVHLISDLISCALDSSGPAGWLLSAATSNENDNNTMEDLVATLRLEVSAALECIEEATYLNGLLGEMVRYGKSVEMVQHSNQSSKSKSRKPKEPLQNSKGRILPLGLRADNGVSFTRVGAGGEIQRRSARDRGNLISKAVGKYSFERIKV